jgi:hypothetical protein
VSALLIMADDVVDVVDVQGLLMMVIVMMVDEEVVFVLLFLFILLILLRLLSPVDPAPRGVRAGEGGPRERRTGMAW